MIPIRAHLAQSDEAMRAEVLPPCTISTSFPGEVSAPIQAPPRERLCQFQESTPAPRDAPCVTSRPLREGGRRRPRALRSEDFAHP